MPTTSSKLLNLPVENTTTLPTMPPKDEGLNYDAILQLHLPGDTIHGIGGLIGLQPLCNSDEHVRDELLKRIKATYTVHAFNSPSLKDIIKVDLGGLKVGDLGLKSFFIYYESLIYHGNMEKAPNLRDFLMGMNWADANSDNNKQAVIDFFGIKHAGPLNTINMQQTMHKLMSEAYKIKGQDWEFTIMFSLRWHKINKIPTLGAGFDGDLGRLTFFE